VSGFPPRSWGRARVEIVTVEPTAIQVTWVGLGTGPVAVQIGDHRRVLHSDGGPGGVVLDGLAPNTGYTLSVDASGVPSSARRRILHTPAAPPGDELMRLSTVSDIHLGAGPVGLLGRVREPHAADPHPLRCGRAAIAESKAWGSELLVVKGDIVEEGHSDEWDHADDMFRAAGMPVSIVPGNHEVKRRRSMDHPVTLVDGGIEIVTGVHHHDLPGLRLILVNSTVEDHGHGAVAHLTDDVVARAADADRPVMVAMHHYAQRFEMPWFWPPGIPGREARTFLGALAAANPRSIVTSGHTHRNRSRRHGPLLVTEVGSTKDFPGVWGGYVVYEGGITQTVRRTLAPEAIGWTEYTRRAVGGFWGVWAAGGLSDRCISHRWPPP
jgi:3',5'-cyclic-AMP phosphodiesterase